MQSPRCHCERGEAIQNPSAETAWIASLRAQWRCCPSCAQWHSHSAWQNPFLDRLDLEREIFRGDPAQIPKVCSGFPKRSCFEMSWRYTGSA